MPSWLIAPVSYELMPHAALTLPTQHAATEPHIHASCRRLQTKCVNIHKPYHHSFSACMKDTYMYLIDTQVEPRYPHNNGKKKPHIN
jgi:hypothetical protein